MIRYFTGNQCNFWSTGVIWSWKRVRVTSLAAEFCILWSFAMCESGRLHKRLLHWSIRHVRIRIPCQCEKLPRGILNGFNVAVVYNVCFVNSRVNSLITPYSVAEFKSFVMNNKAFGNLFCNSQKSFHTCPGSSDSNNIEAIDHSLNSVMAFALTKNPRRNFFFVNAIVEFKEWSIASIIRVVRSRGGVKTLLWITE